MQELVSIFTFLIGSSVPFRDSNDNTNDIKILALIKYLLYARYCAKYFHM